MAFIKNQSQTINGTEYNYKYIYQSYYEPGMDNPTNFKIGKVGDSPSELASNFREQAESKGIDVSEEEIKDLKNTVEEAQERAEDDEDIAEYIEERVDEESEDDSEEEETEESVQGEKILDKPKDLTEIAPESYEGLDTKKYEAERISYVLDRPGYDEDVVVFEHRRHFATEDQDELKAVGYQTYTLGEDDKFKSQDPEEVWEEAKKRLDSVLEGENRAEDYYAEVGDKIEVKGTPPGVFANLTGEWVIVEIYDHHKGEAVVLGKPGKRKTVLKGSGSSDREGKNRELVLKDKLENNINSYDPDFSSKSKEGANGVFLRERDLEGEYIKEDKTDEDDDSSVKNDSGDESIENLNKYLEWYEDFLRHNEFYIKSERGDINFDLSVTKRRKQILKAVNDGIEHESIREDVAYPERLDKMNGKWAFVWTSDLTGNDAFITVNKALDSAMVSESGDNLSRSYSPRKTDIITQIKDKVQPVVDEYDGWQLDQTGDSFTVHDGDRKLEIEAREDYYCLFGEDLENMVEAQGFSGTHDVKKDGDKYLRKYGSNHDVRDFIEFYDEDFPEIQETYDSPYVFGLFDRENDYKEIVFVENRDDDKFTPKVLDLESSEDRFQVLGSNGRKTRYEFMEAKKIVDSYVDEDRDTVEVIHAENEGEISEEYIEELRRAGQEEDAEDDFNEKKAVKMLTKRGVIVERDAVEELRPGDVEVIEDLDTTPMFLSKSMLKKLRSRSDVSGEASIDQDAEGDIEYRVVEILTDVPEFMGVDMETYGAFEEGDGVKLPEDNAEILINRGNAEEVEGDSSVKNEDDRFEEDMIEKYGGLGAINVYLYRNNSEVPKNELETKFGEENVKRILKEDGFSITTHGGEKHVLQLSEENERAEKLIEKNRSDSSDNQDKNDGSMDIEDGYVEVEFLQKTPQFMGTDLEQYGGFEKGDVAEIPEDNAEILENRGNVEVKKGSPNVAEEDNQSNEDKESQDSSSEGDPEEDNELDRLRELIHDLDDGEGADFKEVVDRDWVNEDLIDELMEAGEAYEPVPGKIKLLDFNRGSDEVGKEEVFSKVNDRDYSKHHEGDEVFAFNHEETGKDIWFEGKESSNSDDYIIYGDIVSVLKDEGVIDADFPEMHYDDKEEALDELRLMTMDFKNNFEDYLDEYKDEEDLERKDMNQLKDKVVDFLDENQTSSGDGVKYEDLRDNREGIGNWMEINGFTEDMLEDAINELLSEGTLYEPRPGHVKKL